VHDLSAWTPEQLSWKPDETTWSALQILEHIVFVEVISLGYMKKKTSDGWENLTRVGDAHIAASITMNLRLLSNDKYKAPDVLPAPVGDKSFQELLGMWEGIRADFSVFMKGLGVEYRDRLIFKHPISGPMTPAQTLEFLNYHIGHHVPQFQRLRDNQGF
jgi:hypothetical protein